MPDHVPTTDELTVVKGESHKVSTWGNLSMQTEQTNI